MFCSVEEANFYLQIILRFRQDQINIVVVYKYSAVSDQFGPKWPVFEGLAYFERSDYKFVHVHGSLILSSCLHLIVHFI